MFHYTTWPSQNTDMLHQGKWNGPCVYSVWYQRRKAREIHEKPYDIKNNLNGLTFIGDEQIVR